MTEKKKGGFVPTQGKECHGECRGNHGFHQRREKGRLRAFQKKKTSSDGVKDIKKLIIVTRGEEIRDWWRESDCT